ncbi:threonine-phosphate decarboxylase CobD [Azotobacter beijerinckii]|uniref:threonine-phosphate decarboxylase n=1 Tax=Azotobacter beijerinckii TaxID=170623 RepID=A0A1I4D9E8_9GAMM|nr:threonine-phosphate decarboxylase CobD [Azotobacter beijerinckii]SFB35869.1 L-threonine O-3-phosphate decarboxylase [Azotobacter beijerinckii]SFK90414.1 L-threonine O-3-phosphate decarboxylase [Azotobacter beijerinckii]
MLEHGGRLRAAAQRYGIPLSDWLDLSTGLAPEPWPVPSIPLDAWARLPEDDDGLAEAACACYGAAQALPVAGSQAAIQALPQLFAPGRIGVLEPSYAEHAQAWQRAGHRLVRLAFGDIEARLDEIDVLVLANPNNPTGERFEPSRLLDWQARLARRGGCLLVDEAFMDCTPGYSLVAHTRRPGLIVLRSFGKFFGLAGIRLGFVLAEAGLLARLHGRLGPWTVGGPARVLGLQALGPASGAARERRARELRAAGERLAELLHRQGLPPAGGTALFQWVRTPEATRLHDFLARRGILVRRFDEPASLRFGLPADEVGWQRLAQALDDYQKESA